MFEKFKSIEFRLAFLMSIFIISVVTANMIGGKIAEINLLSIPITFSIGIIPIFLTFFVLDSINEVFGQQKARETIWLAIFAQILIFGILLLSLALPYSSRSWVSQNEFESVFGLSLRMIIASLVAFLLADLTDAFVFSKIREKTKGKMLWLRSNLSNFIGETIDTFAFMFIAFFDPFSGHGVGFVLQLIWPYLTLKLILSIINTPFVYAGVKWLRGNSKKTTF